ncbi:hypothetical protein LAZ67_12001050 [Cordylochernes scorpioides]|uniref:Uncharacterized protein n=1 Tax=Cordylochernes scorpioides TaxID=51811 RepID=A0ABY6L4I8_9ARAC|nr:hypothetical protein LAZ67_12001050 [Cordylochernes scorpioides]
MTRPRYQSNVGERGVDSSCHVAGAKNIIPVWGRTESGYISGEKKTYQLASGRVDDPTRRCQERLTSERSTRRCKSRLVLNSVIKTSGGAPIVCAERAIKGFYNGNRGNQKALKKDSDAVKYLMTKFPKISSSKILEGIFIGPQIRKLINDEDFIATSKEEEKNA